MQDPAPIQRSAGHARRRRQRRLPIYVAVPLWTVVALLAVVVVMRLVAWDDVEPFAVLNAFTVLVYLPAWIVLLVAMLGRRYVLAAAALPVVVAQVVFLAPELIGRRAGARLDDHRPHPQLFDANTDRTNKSLGGYAEGIAQVQPQLVTMEEQSGRRPELNQAGVLEGSPLSNRHHYAPTRAAFFVASRYPLTRPHRLQLRPPPHRSDRPRAAVGAPTLVGRPHHRPPTLLILAMAGGPGLNRTAPTGSRNDQSAGGRGLQRHLGKPRDFGPSSTPD